MRPVVIAHRGASGHLPEHTLQAKALAFAMGADYLEQDVVATRDDRLVVLHDIHLDRVTDVASRHPDRARADGRYYVRDFDLAEIEQLRVHERRNAEGQQVFQGRRNYAGADFRVHSLERELELVETLAAGTGREIGIYPEIKSPAWHREEGVDISALVLDTLGRFGYATNSDPCYLQCFEMEEILRIRHGLGSELKLVQLIGEEQDDQAPINFVELLASSSVANLVATVDGLGPDIEQLYRIVEGSVVDTGLVRLAHDLGLIVHPYTFRDDALPPGFASIDDLYAFAIGELSIDGFFTDFPDSAVRFLQRHRKIVGNS